MIQEHRAAACGLTLEVDRQEIAIDGRIRASLALQMPADRLAALPELPDRFGPFAVVTQSPAETSSAAVRSACAVTSSSSPKASAR